MRKLVLAVTAIGLLGAMSVAADAMPAAGSASVAPTATVNPAIQKTEVVVVKKRRPAAVVVKKRPAVIVKKRPVRPAAKIVVH